MQYVTGKANQYLAITGPGIEGIRIEKKGFIYPFQICQKISLLPREYSIDLQAMTREKLQFLLPVVFTIGPNCNKRGKNANKTKIQAAKEVKLDLKGKNPASASDNAAVALQQDLAREDGGDALVKYAMLLADGTSKGTDYQHLDKIVKGIIEGETRVIVSMMTMEEIFSEREQFKTRIYMNIQTELDQFGLMIYNANVKELADAPHSNYFESMSKKAHEGAINQARIDVADAQRKGNVGEAQRHGEQNREIAKIHAETAVQKTIRDSEKARAEAELATAKTGFDRDVNIAQIEATRRTEERDEELRKAVEKKRAETELERLRALDVVKATILRESKQQAADAKNYEAQAQSNAEYYSEQKAADAHAYKTEAAANAAIIAEQKTADAAAYRIMKAAEANFLAQSKEAEAALLRREKEAAGLTAMATAYSHLSQALGGPEGLIKYLMIEKGVYTDLAKANADAVRGMNPKMTIWNTGSQAGEAAGAEGKMGGVESIRNMYQMLPPLMTTINEQTGVVLPEWQFGKLGNELSGREVNGAKKINGMANGH
ncbi:hypothetical protein BP5796_08185 [Coleophoma crateriformis]|uniref:Band 7 domain-containing protein n=1 Tax=Coleophoma crateriformis TaxID=565419 RepID=A0A3D8RE42_9HELO|nr:hypothetical protein BP5796_08185 [Coleophoma crateriformis]